MKKDAIIEAATLLFLNKTYENTSMQDIISKVGIAKGTIYHHFPSKEALLNVVLEKMVSEYVKKLEKTLKKSKGSALERLQVFAKASNVGKGKKKLVEDLHKPGNALLHTRQLALLIQKIAPFLAEIIREGVKEGVFQTDHPLEVAEFLLSGRAFMTDIGIYPFAPDDLKRRQAAFSSLAEAQLNAPKGSLKFLGTHNS